MSQCNEAPNIYIVELDMAEAGKPVDWSRLPPANKPKGPAMDCPENRPCRVETRKAGRPWTLGLEDHPYLQSCRDRSRFVRHPNRALERDCPRGRVFRIDPERAGTVGFEAKQYLPVAVGGVDASVDRPHQ